MLRDILAKMYCKRNVTSTEKVKYQLLFIWSSIMSKMYRSFLAEMLCKTSIALKT